MPSLEIIKEDIGKPTIVGVTCTILVLLFLIQPFGTTKIASVFAPVVIIWLTLNLSFGIYVGGPTPVVASRRLTKHRRTWSTSIMPS